MSAKDFIFSPKYKVRRHLAYWSFHITVWALFWMIMGSGFSFARQAMSMLVWTPVFILFGYPLVYIAIPHLLLKDKVWQFFLVVLVWGGLGLFLNGAYRLYVYVPLQELMHFKTIYRQAGIMPMAVNIIIVNAVNTRPPMAMST